MPPGQDASVLATVPRSWTRTPGAEWLSAGWLLPVMGELLCWGMQAGRLPLPLTGTLTGPPPVA